jgi:thiol-disulfide isomerase/thioredoxin
MKALRGALGCLALALTASAAPPGATGDGKVTLKAITYPELGKAIRGLTGKVVVVDFWASWCVPCRKEFPGLVRLHQMYANKGFAAVSVSIDKPEAAKAAEDFLREQNATFTNWRLSAEPGGWEKKISSVPTVFLFDRENALVKKWPVLDAKGEVVEPVSYAAIEKVVVELLNKK